MELVKYTEIGKTSYYQLPKSLFSNQYKNLRLEAKMVYALFYDRLMLSLRNGWKDQDGNAYIIYKQSEVAELLNISLRTAKRIYSELKDSGLIDIKQQGMGKPALIYIYKLDSHFDPSDNVNNDTTEGDNYDTTQGDNCDTLYGDSNDTSYKSETEYSETDSNKTEDREKEKRTLSYESVREKDADASRSPISAEPTTTCKPKKKIVAFVPPTYDEVREYCLLRNNDVDPGRFIDYYESNGWLVGRNKMKDWKAAVRNWERREVNFRRPCGHQAANDKQEAISTVQRLAMKYAEEGISDG